MGGMRESSGCTGKFPRWSMEKGQILQRCLCNPYIYWLFTIEKPSSMQIALTKKCLEEDSPIFPLRDIFTSSPPRFSKAPEVTSPISRDVASQKFEYGKIALFRANAYHSLPRPDEFDFISFISSTSPPSPL
ncbi:MAG: hypothetical protein ACTFAL_04450 [Candidatus Electronema sp. V4]|uniref:hypothetical protein n=1 Tax=Candidatus Electronema sp. V4 TaxID=3454756 RepID=UPI0040555AE1